MLNKYSLPFNENSRIKSYFSVTFPYEIIQNHIGNGYAAWISGKYINCYFNAQSRKNKFRHTIYDFWSADKKTILYQSINLDKEIFIIIKDLKLLIKKLILSETYIAGACNAKCFFEECKGNESEMLTDYLITGYHDAGKKLRMHIFNPTSGFCSFDIDFELYYKSISDTSLRTIWLHFWKYNIDAEITLDLPNIIKDLSDYIRSENLRTSEVKGRTFGVAGISDLKDYLTTQILTGNIIEQRYLQTFLEHKYFMHERVQYFEREGFLKKGFSDYSEKVLNIAQNIYSIGSEYNKVMQKSLSEEICKNFINTISLESEFLPCMINELKKTI